jgi:glycosyltransferase involved in cell wall biosynthesis
MVCPLLYWIRILFHITIYYTEISSPKWRSKTVDKIHDKKYLNSFDTIFVPSKLIGEELITYDGLIKTYTIIPFFIDLPPYCFATPNRTANTFGVIARLSDEKNQDVLIRVLKKVLIKNTKAQLILIGTGPKAQELRNLAHSLGISDQIVFISHFERVEDIIEYIDIVTLCSDAEGMPLTLLEALYFGKPIIGTSVGSIPDMVFNDYNGYIINKYEIDEIADRILKIMENSNLYCKMAINSRELSISQFHTESLFKKLLPYYENKY